ncbi:hypothetical protein H5410_030621 [Solanum commersonii]|uniref:Uncharacterized protein n=1 Tax=Solanum commersonii TaxID=4109 RepID=A0A9J5YET8_SOLCO|nr:hypothetical protein H5410_030621 [Solanum commersonii]
MILMKDTLSQAVRIFQTLKKIIGLNYEDLCRHPNFEIPRGYKIPKFDTFNEAAKVQPVMTESKMTNVFIQAQEPEYHERMLRVLGQKVLELIKMGEAIDDGLKS